MTGLLLRHLTPGDEAAVRTAHGQLRAEDVTFALGYEEGMARADHLALLEDQRVGRHLPPDRVPATFLVADVDGRVVGRASVRHRLDGWLRHEGGHIGYAVVPGERRKGPGGGRRQNPAAAMMEPFRWVPAMPPSAGADPNDATAPSAVTIQ